jgi:hypothetical protein
MPGVGRAHTLCARSNIPGRGSFEGGDGLAQVIGDALMAGLVIPYRRRKRTPGQRLSESHADRPQTWHAPVARQGFERARNMDWNRRNARARENTTDTREKALETAIGRAPTLGKPCQVIAARKHRLADAECPPGQPIVGREHVQRAPQRIKPMPAEKPHRIAGPIKPPRAAIIQRGNDH